MLHLALRVAQGLRFTARRCSLQLHNACLSSLAYAKPLGLEALSCSGCRCLPCAGPTFLTRRQALQ